MAVLLRDCVPHCDCVRLSVPLDDSEAALEVLTVGGAVTERSALPLKDTVPVLLWQEEGALLGVCDALGHSVAEALREAMLADWEGEPDTLRVALTQAVALLVAVERYTGVSVRVGLESAVDEAECDMGEGLPLVLDVEDCEGGTLAGCVAEKDTLPVSDREACAEALSEGDTLAVALLLPPHALLKAARLLVRTAHAQPQASHRALPGDVEGKSDWLGRALLLLLGDACALAVANQEDALLREGGAEGVAEGVPMPMSAVYHVQSALR